MADVKVRTTAALTSGTPKDAAALAYALTEIFVTIYVVVGFGAYNSLGTVPLIALGLFGCGCLAIAPRNAIGRIPVNGWLLALLVWMTVSYSWSANIYETKFLLRTEVLLTLGAVGAAGTLPLARFVSALLRGIYLSVFITIVALVVDPFTRASYGATGDSGVTAGWHGYFVHKNAMTAFLMFGLSTVAAFEPNAAKRQFFAIVSLVLVIGGSSGTGLSGYLVIVATWIWMSLYERETVRRRSAFVALSVMGFAVFIAFVFAALPLIVNLYGKDLTFTGRTKIWSAAMWGIRRAWFAGYGHGGVWYNGGLQPTVTIVKLIGFAAGHAHNAYLEILLELGVVGLLLYVALICSALRASGRQLGREGLSGSVGRWGVSLVASYFMFTLSESLVFSAWFVMLTWVYVVARRWDLAGQPALRDGGRR